MIRKLFKTAMTVADKAERPISLFAQAVFWLKLGALALVAILVVAVLLTLWGILT